MMSKTGSSCTNIKVNVAMITYNHEQFIAQAIESVLMQQTNFAIELVIGEDCSTDGTRAIVIEYARKYPEQIHIILHEHNVGAKTNAVAVFKACRGQYLAALEGDDFWTSAQKLQLQVDALDGNPNWFICTHRINVFFEDGTQPSYLAPCPSPKPVSTLDDLALAPFVFTSTAVFRRIPIECYPDWFFQVEIGDYAHSVFYAQHGKIGFIDEVMSAYRKHEGGFWSQRESLMQRTALARDLRIIARHLGWRHRRGLESQAAQALLKNLKTHLANGSLSEARKVAAEIFSMTPYFPDLPWNRFAKRSLMAYFPQIFPNLYRRE
ncbi:MAG: glycosyltransferase [Chloroflexi bacterium]|nr:glycosyltransferase [Chloroflexota bacterium]